MRKLLILTVVIVLLPLQAFAAVCFSVPESSGPSTFVLEVASVGGRFFSLVGEVVLAPGDVCPSYPVSGSAHLRSDGKAHFGLTVHEVSLVDPGCVPSWIVGTLNPPSFNSGSALFQNLRGEKGSVVLTPADCPPLPE